MVNPKNDGGGGGFVRTFIRPLLLPAMILGGGVCCTLSLLYVNQHRLLYMPRLYATDAAYYRAARSRFENRRSLIDVEYVADAAARTAYYVPPQGSSAAAPPALWILYGGNAALALDWLDSIAAFEESEREAAARTAFYLIDYPGYGVGSEASAPNEASVAVGTDAALKALAEQLGDQLPLTKRFAEINALGHSLGCAATLQLAASARPASPPLTRVALFSPFTTIAEMAVSLFPPLGLLPLLSSLVRDPWDNRAALASVLRDPARAPREITIVHGRRDEIVPFGMGAQLARLASEEISSGTGAEKTIVRWAALAADHNTILGASTKSSRNSVFVDALLGKIPLVGSGASSPAAREL